MNVELRIEELVLHGFPPCSHHRIGDAAERELSRLFAERGVPPALVRSADTSHLNAGAFEMDPGQRPETIGAQVAQAVYGVLSPHQHIYQRRRSEGQTG